MKILKIFSILCALSTPAFAKDGMGLALEFYSNNQVGLGWYNDMMGAGLVGNFASSKAGDTKTSASAVGPWVEFHKNVAEKTAVGIGAQYLFASNKTGDVKHEKMMNYSIFGTVKYDISADVSIKAGPSFDFASYEEANVKYSDMRLTGFVGLSYFFM